MGIGDLQEQLNLNDQTLEIQQLSLSNSEEHVSHVLRSMMTNRALRKHPNMKFYVNLLSSNPS
jgi:hypothetical protein